MEYTVYKFFQCSLLNEQGYEKLKNQILLFPDDYLNLLLQFVVQNQNTGFFTTQIRKNIFDLLSYVRQNLEYENFEDKKNKYEIINEIIGILNVVDFGLNNLYYKINEVEKRYHDSTKYIVTEEEISNDLIYLCNLLNNLEAEELEKFIMNDEFIGSVNAMIDENPNLVNDEKFIENLNKVLEMNINICGIYISRKLNEKHAKYIINRTLNLKYLIDKLPIEINKIKTSNI